MNEVFLDANILMEILFQRPKYNQIKEALSKFSVFYASFLSAHIVMYFTELEGLDVQTTFALLENIQILENNSETLELAKNIYQGKDFEDCLQITCCLQNNLQNFLTLDKNLAKNHSGKLNVILL